MKRNFIIKAATSSLLKSLASKIDFSSHAAKKQHNRLLFDIFNKKYPGVCRSVSEFIWWSKAYKDENFISSMFCPLCGRRVTLKTANTGYCQTCPDKHCRLDISKEKFKESMQASRPEEYELSTDKKYLKRAFIEGKSIFDRVQTKGRTNIGHYKPNVLLYKEFCEKYPGVCRNISQFLFLVKNKHKKNPTKNFLCYCGKRKSLEEKYCSKGCVRNSKDFRRKLSESLKKTFEERGEEIAEKHRQTYRRRYGVDNIMQLDSYKKLITEKVRKCKANPEWKEHIRQRNLAKYGVEFTSQREDVKEKKRKTFMEKTGYSCVFANPEAMKEIQRKRFERTGYYHASQNPEVQEKLRAAWKEKYGTEKGWVGTEEGRKFLREMCKKKRHKRITSRLASNSYRSSKEEDSLFRILQSYYGDKKVLHQFYSKRYPWICDFYIPEEDLYIEYQGCQDHGTEPYVGNKKQKKIVKVWKKRSKKHARYNSMLETWMKKDPAKRAWVKKKELNWKEFFTTKDICLYLYNKHKKKTWCSRKKVYSQLVRFLDKNNVDFIQKKSSVLVGKLIIKIIDPFIYSYGYKEPKILKLNNLYNKYTEKGYQCLFILKPEWEEKRTRKIWKSMILNKLGKSKRVFARKCSIVKPSKAEIKSFLEENHLQGNSRCTKAYGLVYNNKLVMLATFGKPRFNARFSWELIRLCGKKNLSVVGGPSRLIKHAREDLSGSIVTYANKRFSEGHVYETLGFSMLNRLTTSNYWYFKPIDNVLLNRLLYQKHLLKNKLEWFSEQETENTLMLKNGFRIFHDCGNLTFGLRD